MRDPIEGPDIFINLIRFGRESGEIQQNPFGFHEIFGKKLSEPIQNESSLSKHQLGGGGSFSLIFTDFTRSRE